MTDLLYADAPEFAEDELMEEEAAPAEADRLMQFAQAQGDISHLLTESELASLGMKVVEDWQRDKASNQTWRDQTEKAIKRAAQDEGDAKTFPWMNASQVNFPILTVAAQQFAARAYPAIVKGDEAVGVKVLGQPPVPPQLPQLPPDQPPPPEFQAVMQGFQQQQAAWQAKKGRAERVKTWMNSHLFYGTDGDWEEGVDALLNQLPIAGMAFKKVYFDPHRGVCSDYVNPLRLTVASDTTSLRRTPRITHDYDAYPYEIREKQAAGTYRETELTQDGDDDQAVRVQLEQYRLEDLDGDGIAEPYIITVDEQSNAVLRIEPDFDERDIKRSKQNDKVIGFRRRTYFIPFPFMPSPEGKFYAIGFGQLLDQISEAINTSINQLNDAATAAAAGGGFIGSGLRLQGAGQTTTLRFQPGEYKYVTGSGQDIKNAVWERTIPNPSPVTFQLLELMLGAAKEVASIKDVLSGDSPATAPVGTTLALIEQGLQAFTAIYKRVYRSMKAEFKAIYECQARWGSPEEYQQLLDDPQADLQADFSPQGDDIVPVSDPSVVTRAQALAKAQVIQQTAQAFPNVLNPQAAVKRILEAAQIDNPEELLPQPGPPPPQMVAELKKTESETARNLAQAENYQADAAVKTGEAQMEGAVNAAFALGTAVEGGVPSLAGEPGQPMGVSGPSSGGGGPAPGMDGGQLGPGGGQPPPAGGAPLAG